MYSNQLAMAIADYSKLCLIAVSTIIVLIIMAVSVLPMVLYDLVKGKKTRVLTSS